MKSGTHVHIYTAVVLSVQNQAKLYWPLEKKKLQYV